MSDIDTDSGHRADCCPHELVEHTTGLRECGEFGPSCPAVVHDGGVVDCSDVLGDECGCPPRPRPGGPAVTWSLPGVR